MDWGEECVEELLKSGADPFIKMMDGNYQSFKTCFEIIKNFDSSSDFPKVRAVLKRYENRLKMQAFLMAQHQRLGARSPTHVLPQELYKEIFRYLLQ